MRKQGSNMFELQAEWDSFYDSDQAVFWIQDGLWFTSTVDYEIDYHCEVSDKTIEGAFQKLIDKERPFAEKRKKEKEEWDKRPKVKDPKPTTMDQFNKILRESFAGKGWKSDDEN